MKNKTTILVLFLAGISFLGSCSNNSPKEVTVEKIITVEKKELADVTLQWQKSRAALVNETDGGRFIYWSQNSFTSDTEVGVARVRVPSPANKLTLKNLKGGAFYYVRIVPYSKIKPEGMSIENAQLKKIQVPQAPQTP